MLFRSGAEHLMHDVHLGPTEGRTEPAEAPVGFREAASILEDPLSTTYPNRSRSRGEQRYVTIGRDTIRMISARPATRRERRFHEEG